METPAELRDQARHARELAGNTFDSQLRKALLDAADEFDAQAALLEHGDGPTIEISPKPEG